MGTEMLAYDGGEVDDCGGLSMNFFFLAVLSVLTK